MDSSSLGTAAKELFAAVTEPGAGETLGLEGWLDVLSDTQAVLNTLAGVQAVAMAQVAAFDSEDGHGVGERRHRGLGHVALDAPDLVAARVGCSAQAAATRMGVAVAQVSSMPALVSAMGDGRLDAFRAAVVADEVADAPAAVQGAVTAELDATGRLVAETAGPLRRRTRRLLAEQAPEVLAERAASERERRGLHRSTSSLGVEHWAAWLPVESSRPAWAAVTTLAQDYLRAGQADTLAQARADALTDLILGQATTTVVLHPTVPLEELHEGASQGPDTDLVAVGGYGTPGQTLVPRAHLRALAQLTRRGSRARRGGAGKGRARARVAECLALDPRTGAVVGTLGEHGDDVVIAAPVTDGYRPSAELERLVKARDGRCRFPGCQVPVRFVDLDHVKAYSWDGAGPDAQTSPANLACLCRRHHRIKQRQGWQAELFADGSMRWTDPTGVVRTTWPDDHRPAASPAHPARAEVAPRPALQTRVQAAELEGYSLLEDGLVDVILEAGQHLPPDLSVHRTLPRARHRPREDAGGTRLCGVRPDRSHWTTPTRTVLLHADTVAEFEAMVARRTAPPF